MGYKARMDGPQKIREWAKFLKDIRTFLDYRTYLEVMTNHLVTAGAFESTLDCLKVNWSSGTGELHTSPEIEMKRVLAAHGESIYQICRSFRDDPATPIHRVEFTMLEFYRMGFTLEQLIEETLQLFSSLAGPRSLKPVHASVTRLLKEKTGVDVLVHAQTESLYAAAKSVGYGSAEKSDTWEDLFFKMVLDEVETTLPPAMPVVLTGYPVRVSPLSRAGEDGNTAERFEIYWHGMEIANGCTELWSADELERRYEKESRAREAAGKPRHPYPQTLIEAAKKDIGIVSGVAIGLERLFFALEKGR